MLALVCSTIVGTESNTGACIGGLNTPPLRRSQGAPDDHRERSDPSTMDVSKPPVALPQIARALPGRAIAPAARRAHQHAVAALEHVLAPVVDRLAVDLHGAEAARAHAREPRRGGARALGPAAAH